MKAQTVADAMSPEPADSPDNKTPEWESSLDWQKLRDVQDRWYRHYGPERKHDR